MLLRSQRRTEGCVLCCVVGEMRTKKRILMTLENAVVTMDNAINEGRSDGYKYQVL